MIIQRVFGTGMVVPTTLQVPVHPGPTGRVGAQQGEELGMVVEAGVGLGDGRVGMGDDGSLAVRDKGTPLLAEAQTVHHLMDDLHFEPCHQHVSLAGRDGQDEVGAARGGALHVPDVDLALAGPQKPV
jgi:hypothetical protein